MAMITGTVYGIALNDRLEFERLEPDFAAKPYLAAPRAPVVYIKPRNCHLGDGGIAVIPASVREVVVQPTLLLEFSRAATRCAGADALNTLGAARLAIDLSLPITSYYRPAFAETCRDGFLPLGAATGFSKDFMSVPIITEIDGRRIHDWSFERLRRPIATLIEDLSDFMTLDAGDALLAGLPGDAPRARAGQLISVCAAGLPPLSITLEQEAAP